MIRSLILIFTLLSASQARANLSCQHISPLVRLLDAASAETVDRATTRSIYADIQRLRREMTTSNTSPTGQDHGSELRTILLLLSEDMRRNAPDALISRLQEDRSQIAMITAGASLIHFGCNGGEGIYQHAARMEEEALAQLDPDDLGDFYLASTSVTWGGLAVLGLGGIVLLQQAYTRMKRRTAHRNTRFPCNISCQLQNKAGRFDAKMRDLNCFGVKIEPAKKMKVAMDDVFDLTIDYRRLPAKVCWVKDDSFGMVFVTPLDPNTVFELVEDSRQAEKEKGRPAMEPSSI